ncbi:hypothetical protein A2291_02730 [candidate division WOR-1 bacterium RIFOXYB2_FULL_42_35]|uniref:Thioesterase domain-containing protein n=1 Tax=candidate division WOR-1 bacterium RIFOXYC2_FULL_41_25 TaxID=1802586 RepID=A0A1F4TJC8_UNCSA|nr:MAG: hypothetical protein A2247_04190 [candidate division WOR-1 bacterium RIFOXYA2_FULL_41_14]OGC22080.1 MAG: hypothetical protein A2291_02730 [candidate division WOR-1 bacterium RIFOXYB2_FULL_42_35]OGC32841.1 MAG: hypothetical protein A2462_06530 [candidate division WOR-1 bacterium RIFOXYC2_FULL_41_25]OGC43339.1 MAG: hypothetical protein A2548_03180 [candidate division WOR-1 bacterium RIFOXYD2_FULL_41_8]
MFATGYKKTFQAHLGDTSAYGNIFYMSYHRWIAITKEDFFNENVSGFSDLFKMGGIKLFVLRSSLKMFGEGRLHDRIEVQLTCKTIRRVRVELVFRCYNLSEEKLIAESNNIIIFVDKGNKPLAIQDKIKQALLSIKAEV